MVEGSLFLSKKSCHGLNIGNFVIKSIKKIEDMKALVLKCL